ncbi:glycerophosphodiester phosphodiesterase [Bacillus timonensis]|nr:glycerophosphodiester phosphodiesterase [Bacillus timonensis]
MEQIVTEVPKRKPKKLLLTLITLFFGLLFFILSMNLFPVEKREQHPFFPEKNRPLIIAHQGGEDLAPSNTMNAFKQAVELEVDVLEFDVHITKDGELVIIHDPTVDRTTNGTGEVAELTLAEIQSLDAGYHFKDLNGQFSYRDKGVYIPTVEEVFKQFPKVKMVIEIKDDNPPERFEEISKRLWSLIKKYQMEQNVLITAFDQEITDGFSSVSNGLTALSAGRQEVIKFVLFHKLFLPNLYSPRVDALQIPISQSGLNLASQQLIDGAHRRGMDVHYWTIDDKETMRQLIELGADGIITNRPDLMKELLIEMGYR